MFKLFKKKKKAPPVNKLALLEIIKNEAFNKNNSVLEDWSNRSSERKSLGNLKYIKNVDIQLSNLCNYSNIHKSCPLNKMKTKEVLRSKIVYKVINELASYGYEGGWQFHLYNEPMIDPRLFMFIKYAKEKCPKSKVLINTNGFWTTQTMIEELEEIGVDSIYNSAYTIKEYERMKKLKSNIGYCIEPMILDDRMSIYEREPLGYTTPCSAPIKEVCINAKGEVQLCCLDWKQSCTFGSLYEKSLSEILNSDKVDQIFSKLSEGKRELPICSRCNWSR